MNLRYVYQKFISELDSGLEIKVCKLGRNHAGFYHPDGGDIGIILIDHRKEDVLSVLVHELFHHCYYDLPHSQIYKRERWFMRNATWPMKKALLQRLVL